MAFILSQKTLPIKSYNLVDDFIFSKTLDPPGDKSSSGQKIHIFWSYDLPWAPNLFLKHSKKHNTPWKTWKYHVYVKMDEIRNDPPGDKLIFRIPRGPFLNNLIDMSSFSKISHLSLWDYKVSSDFYIHMNTKKYENWIYML